MWSALSNVADNIPVVGHIKGTVHYISGDQEAGDKAMKDSSRATAVTAGGIGGFCVAGPVGAVAGGLGAGAAVDTAITGVDSAVHGKYRPHGNIKNVGNIVNDPSDVSAWADLGMDVAGDMAGGTGGGAMAKSVGKTAVKSGMSKAVKKETNKYVKKKVVKKMKKAAKKDLKRAIKNGMADAEWSPLYGCDQKSGCKVRTFDVDGVNHEITGVAVAGGQFVNSLQFQIDGKWQQKVGGKDGVQVALVLRADEYFEKIDLRCGGWLDFIQITTNKGRTISKGGNGGKYHAVSGSGGMLVGCNGKGGEYVEQVQFKFISI